MAKNRYVNTSFWSDSWIVDLEPLERYLFLYLLTNAHTNILGIYELPAKVICYETGLARDDLDQIFNKLHPRAFYIDGWIYLPNFLKHQGINPNIEKGIDLELDRLPERIKSKILDLPIGSERLSKALNYRNLNLNLNSNSNSNGA